MFSFDTTIEFLGCNYLVHADYEFDYGKPLITAIKLYREFAGLTEHLPDGRTISPTHRVNYPLSPPLADDIKTYIYEERLIEDQHVSDEADVSYEGRQAWSLVI